MTNDLPILDLFYGDLTANRAVVYARLSRPADDAGLTLTGQIRGPRCLHAQTLPLASPLIDRGPGPTLLAQAVVPEPVFWSPDLPAIYDVTVHLLRGSEVVATTHREIGLRALGIRERHLFLDARRWVLRGVSTESTTATLPRAWHEQSAAYVADDSDLELLAEATQWGALVVVKVTESGALAATRLRELARFPAVAIAVISGPLPADFRKSHFAPNLLLAQLVQGDCAQQAYPWADLLIVIANDLGVLTTVANDRGLPVLVTRHLAAPIDLASGRAACDALQRDLAPLGQFAGYIV
jgi:hypothetical protein